MGGYIMSNCNVTLKGVNKEHHYEINYTDIEWLDHGIIRFTCENVDGMTETITTHISNVIISEMEY